MTACDAASWTMKTNLTSVLYLKKHGRKYCRIELYWDSLRLLPGESQRASSRPIIGRNDQCRYNRWVKSEKPFGAGIGRHAISSQNTRDVPRCKMTDVWSGHYDRSMRVTGQQTQGPGRSRRCAGSVLNRHRYWPLNANSHICPQSSRVICTVTS